MHKLFIIFIIIFGSLILIGCSEKVETKLSIESLICKDDSEKYQGLSYEAVNNVSYWKNGFFRKSSRTTIEYEDKIYYKNIIYKFLKKESRKSRTAKTFHSYKIIEESNSYNFDYYLFEEEPLSSGSGYWSGRINKSSLDEEPLKGHITITWNTKQTKTGKHASAWIEFSCKPGKNKI